MHDLVDFNLWNESWDQTLADFNKDFRHLAQGAMLVPSPHALVAAAAVASEPQPPWVTAHGTSVDAQPPPPPIEFL